MPAADELDLLPGVEQYLDDAGRVARAVVVEDDDAVADGARPEQHVPTRQDVVLVAPRELLDQRVDAREADAAGDRTRGDDDAVRL